MATVVDSVCEIESLAASDVTKKGRDVAKVSWRARGETFPRWS